MKNRTILILTLLFAVNLFTSCFFNTDHDNPYDPENPKNLSSAPPVPADLAPGVVTTNSISIRWNGTAGVTGYKIYRSSDNNNYIQITAVSGGASYTGISYIDTGLTANTTYYYKVSAYSNAGESDKCGSISVKTLSEIDPTGLTLGTVTSSSISISWDSVPGAAGYNIFRSTDGSNYFKAGNVTGTDYTDTGLEAGTVYYYEVTSYDSGGESGKSAPVSGITIAGAPAGVSAGSATVNSLTITWNSTTGAASYNVYRSADGGATYTNKVGSNIVTGTSYTDTGLTAGTVYYYEVTAVNSSGESAKSISATGYTTPNTTNLTLGTITATSIQFSWDGETGATGYNIYRSTNGTDFSFLVNSLTTNYTNSGLTSGATYYYKVTSYNSGGESAFSNSISGTTFTYATVTTTAIAGNVTTLVSVGYANSIPLSGCIAGTSAQGGGNVTSGGNSAVVDRGVCWNTAGSPTVSGAHASDGTTGTGVFTNSKMTGLTQNTIYHVRAYATNNAGTAYGNEITFNSGYIFGAVVAAGLVFYNNGAGHGIVCAPADQSTSQVWITGTYRTTLIGSSAAGTAVGTGQTNTAAIIAADSSNNNAAYICANSSTFGSAGYLPSRDELACMYNNLKRNSLGSFTGIDYWCSTESSAWYAWHQDFYAGDQYYDYSKGNPYNVRAVRNF